MFQFQHSFGRTLGIAGTLLFRHLSKELKENNLPITPEQFKVLTHLWQKDGRSQQELASLSDRNRANVTRIIDILEREGIVERRNDENDRRVNKIYLTELGKDLEEDAAKCAEQTLNFALQNIKKSEIETSRQTLLQIIKNLE